MSRSSSADGLVGFAPCHIAEQRHCHKPARQSSSLTGLPAHFAARTVRHRTKVTKGPGSKAAGIAMAFKLIEAAQQRWRAVNAPHLVALVRAGAKFERGKLIERETPRTASEATEAA